ncbi:hypothetical protein ACNKU7_08420 [Microbulbifer sp. SA54]|uniref:capsular polysaccharide export protein, LipB/KpsS family n=1 Tax=Microbulbifer sp. SA54 TaxID=3401577 RepID=UPI003AAAF77E
MNYEILISDSLHIHEKNFKPVFEHFKRSNISFNTYSKNNNHRNESIDKCISGDSETSLTIRTHSKRFNRMDDDAFFNYTHRGLRILTVVELEILNNLISEGNFHYQFYSQREFFDYCLSHHRKKLKSAYALAVFWVDRWFEELNTKNYRYALVFSGSTISAFSLLKTCQFFATEPLILETFFTGRHFYIENRYTPIPNNSEIKYICPEYTIEYDTIRWRRTNEAIRKTGVNNKNVKQSKQGDKFQFEPGFLLLLCQVSNDYSIINQRYPKRSTVDVYKKLIDKIINETSYNLVIKTHPWERNNLKYTEYNTYSILSIYKLELPKSAQMRIHIVEDCNIVQLIEKSETALGICSQSLLEACFYGKKPIVVNNAFFSGKGFTYDMPEINHIPELVNDEKFTGLISLDEYKSFMNFINQTLHEHLVESDHYSEAKLSRIFMGCRSSARSHYPINKEEKFSYLSQSSFWKRNVLKLIENPKQVFADVKNISRSLIPGFRN